MRTLFVRLGDAIGIGAFGLFVLAALWILYLWITAMAGWMGWPGLLLGIASAPCAVTFPFVYWYVEGAFPAAEFAVWALSLCGIAISMAWKALRPR
jgi:hypothetical protein